MSEKGEFVCMFLSLCMGMCECVCVRVSERVRRGACVYTHIFTQSLHVDPTLWKKNTFYYSHGGRMGVMGAGYRLEMLVRCEGWR